MMASLIALNTEANTLMKKCAVVPPSLTPEMSARAAVVPKIVGGHRRLPQTPNPRGSRPSPFVTPCIAGIAVNMAFTKKKKRRIVVGDREYFWSATGDDGWINLRVMTDVNGGQQLWCMFEYHHDRTPQGDGSVSLTNQFVVTPFIVRQAIEYGLSQGWTPLSGGGELRLGHIDDNVDLRLDQNRVEAIKAAVQADEEPT